MSNIAYFLSISVTLFAYHYCFGEAGEVSSLGLNSVMKPTQSTTLVSPNRTFAAGFISIGNQAYAFGIWYATIPDRTVTWLANRDHAVDQNSSLILTKNGDMVISRSNGTVIWATNTSDSQVKQAVLLENGNLVLNGSIGEPVWQSFDYPTDTLLPQQTFKDKIPLVSRKNEHTYSSGVYTLSFNKDNRLSLFYGGLGVAVPEQYWVDLDSLDQTQYAMTGGGAGLIISSAGINTTGGIIISDGIDFMTSDFGEGHLRRLTLDADGNLRVYGWQKNTSKWIVVWKAIQQQCKIYGMCGPNALCADKSDHTQECICPPGFHMKNDSDHSQGCDRDIDLKCNESASKFVNLEFASYQGHDLLRLSFQTLKDCETACLDNCSCLAFSYMYDQYPWKALGSENCYLKGRLLYGYRSPNSKSFMFIRVSVNDTNSSAAIASISRLTNPSLNLVCPSDLRLKFPTITYSSQEVTTAIVVSSSILLVEIIAGAAAACFLVSKYKILRDAERYGIEILSGRPKKFTYAELETATNNFSEVLGKGAFGTVYKGSLPDHTPIAVKKIHRVTEGQEEFWAEVTIICRIHHVNLVRMWGFCAEGEHRLLVYEYVSNGSLDTHLFPSPKKRNPPSLDWKTRYQIAVRTAKGIAYLHEECLEWILHCDIKPQNVLLDEKFCPKVSDFGLAKLVNREIALSVSRIRGTRGYLAPEWTENRPITSKADVYSFGMVLLKIVSGRRDFEFLTAAAMEVETWRFPVWAFEMMKRGEIREIVDQNMGVEGKHEWDEDEVERVMKTAFWCIQTDPLLRPSMGKPPSQVLSLPNRWRRSLPVKIVGYRLKKFVEKVKIVDYVVSSEEAKIEKEDVNPEDLRRKEKDSVPVEENKDTAKVLPENQNVLKELRSHLNILKRLGGSLTGTCACINLLSLEIANYLKEVVSHLKELNSGRP
eukprot:Gb_23772 [translate_table: standard]